MYFVKIQWQKEVMLNCVFCDVVHRIHIWWRQNQWLDWLANLVDGGSIIFEIFSQNPIAISLSLNYNAIFLLFIVYLIFNFKVDWKLCVFGCTLIFLHVLLQISSLVSFKLLVYFTPTMLAPGPQGTQSTRLSPACQCFHLIEKKYSTKVLKSLTECLNSSNIII